MKHLGRLKLGIVLGALAICCAGCMSQPVTPAHPPLGWTFSGVGYPTSINFHNTRMKGASGQASTTCILGFAFGDCSVATAAENGGIATVSHVDSDYLSVLGLYSKYTTIVYGE